VENCNCDNADELISDQVIEKCSRIAAETHLTLEKVHEIARYFEAVDIQLEAMTGVEEDRRQVNRIEQRETGDQFKGKEAKARCCRCDREVHFSRDGSLDSKRAWSASNRKWHKFCKQ